MMAKREPIPFPTLAGATLTKVPVKLTFAGLGKVCVETGLKSTTIKVPSVEGKIHRQLAQTNHLEVLIIPNDLVR